MKITRDKRMPLSRSMAIVSLIGLPLTALFVIFLKKNQIYTFKLAAPIFIFSVIVPLALFAIFLFDEKVLQQRRLKKLGPKKFAREKKHKRMANEARIPFVMPHVLLILFLAVVIEILQFPEGDVNNGPFTIILASLLILSPPLGCLSILIISTRIFKKNKGVRKTLKYIVELKKPPKLLTRLWLKASGFNNQEIKNYLLNLNKKSYK